jgi:hypothetical protein
MQKGDLVELAVHVNGWNQRRAYEKGEVGVLETELADHVVGGLWVYTVTVLIDGQLVDFFNTHIRLCQTSKEVLDAPDV